MMATLAFNELNFIRHKKILDYLQGYEKHPTGDLRVKGKKRELNFNKVKISGLSSPRNSLLMQSYKSRKARLLVYKYRHFPDKITQKMHISNLVGKD